MTAPQASAPYWAVPSAELLRTLDSSAAGLTAAEAAARLDRHGPNALRAATKLSRLGTLARQLRSPLLLLLIFAAGASFASGQWLDAGVVLAIIAGSVALAYRNEFRAQTAIAALRARLGSQASVVRDGQPAAIAVEHIVPGDVVLLAAGTLVPADGVLLEATDLFLSEAVLTGESFPVEKRPGVLAASAPLATRTNCALRGTNVRSGSGRLLVVATGNATEFGGIAQRLALRPPATEFERGIARFGYLLASAMSIMVLVLFVGHVLLGRAPLETLLFAVALAVGLSPELLPAILTANLARGAEGLARLGVLVRRLSAIENLGSMDVLCTDKTGTLTEGVVRLEGAYDAAGSPSPTVLALAAWNARLETGIVSPLDDAIDEAAPPDSQAARKLGEIPFDFVRKRVTVVVERDGGACLVTKGAFRAVLEACTTQADGAALDPVARAALERRHDAWAAAGVRVLAVATRRMAAQGAYSRDDEHDLEFHGFLTFTDRPKAGAAEAIAALAARGVAVKLISGDSRLVALHVARLVGLGTERVLSGGELDELHDEALWQAAERTDLFVEVDPNQKERIILALRKMGHVVGFLGDGVNDAPAMHAADTSLSVDGAVDVAREAADFVLLERGLGVIEQGIDEGRRTFANTLKYLLITTSANLGNMVSMAVASLFLPFLPLTAGQILLNNFLSDVPAVGVATDRVDPELVAKPQRWRIGVIGRYMAEFGASSAAFDFVTFAVLLYVFRADPATFRTTWFVESLLTELVVALVMRTRRPFYRSRPGTLLLASTAALIPLALAVPYLPYAALLGFVPLPAPLAATVIGITVVYALATELQKRAFYRPRR